MASSCKFSICAQMTLCVVCHYYHSYYLFILLGGRGRNTLFFSFFLWVRLPMVDIHLYNILSANTLNYFKFLVECRDQSSDLKKWKVCVACC